MKLTTFHRAQAVPLKKLGGFTLIEMLVAAIVVGILASYWSAMASKPVLADAREYDSRNRLNNRQIQDAIYSYLENQYTKGQLPAPYTGGGYASTIYNPGDTSQAGTQLAQNLTSLVPVNEINDDGSAVSNVRVYQMLPGLTQTLPFEVTTGPLVTLTYQVGVIYLTKCPKANATCNPSSASGVPGDSPRLTVANYANFAVAGKDDYLVGISSLPRQRSMLEATKARIDILRDRFLNNFRLLQIKAAAGDDTNFYPTDSTSLAGQSPGTNQGCRDGWYSLASSTILSKIQLSSQEYGSTYWGGPIEFCRDYDPTGTKAPDASPHSAAFRINANLSVGASPDPSVPGNNVVFTF